MTGILDDDDLGPPGKPDFRRVGRGTPYVVGPAGKRVRYGRPSNAGKILDDESNLTDWKLRTTVVGAAQRPDLMAVISTLDPESDKKKLRDIAEECLVAGKGKQRAVKGEAVHSMFDHIDREDDWEPAPQWVALCDNYRRTTREVWGLQPVEIEAHCINDAFRLAGSMDRRYRTTKVLVAPDGTTVPIGSMVAADTKTGSTLEYATGSYATQLAAYADSLKYNVETDEREPFTPPTFEPWGLIIHADSATSDVQVFWVDLNAGREGLRLSQQVKQWRTRSDLLTLGAGPVMLAPSSPREAPVVAADSQRTLSLLGHTQRRVRAIVGQSQPAAFMLQRLWPEGVPGLKAGGHSWDQLQQIIPVVEKVEAEFHLPFFEAWVDPEEESRERHPSNQPGPVKEPSPARVTIVDMVAAHPKGYLIREWVGRGVAGGLDPDLDPTALGNALLQFASIDTSDWTTAAMGVDDQLTVFLDATLRALGYSLGLVDLGKVKPADVPGLLGAIFAISTGTAMVLYGQDSQPILRSNIQKGQ